MVFNFNSRGYTRMRYRGAFNCFIPLYRCLFDHRPFPMQDIEFKNIHTFQTIHCVYSRWMINLHLQLIGKNYFPE